MRTIHLRFSLQNMRALFVIEEVQKVPKLFDAIKSEVDRKRILGSFFITGSQSFDPA